MTARSRYQQHASMVALLVGANLLVMAGLWWRHGGPGTLDLPGGTFTALGQVAGLGGTYFVLLEVLLMSRIGWLERFLGLDLLAAWHRWLGFASVTLLTAHAVFITIGYAQSGRQPILRQLGDFIRHYPDVLMSMLGLALFVAIAVSSIRAARRRLSREAWYSLHLYAYLAIALSFAHQLAVGSDLNNDALARVWWVGLYVAVFGMVFAWRVARPIAFNVRHQLRVHSVRTEADGVVSVYLSGRLLSEVGAEPGQFFLWRFVTGMGWAKAHPYSLSAVPNADFLRITVKDLGDDSGRLAWLRPGTRVFAEGPYGAFTASRRTRRRVALIAGGIGITPLRALVEALPGAPGDVTLLYRAASARDLVFERELEVIAQHRGFDVRYLVGAEIGNDQTDQLGTQALHHYLPDIAERDVYLCGPPSMITAVRRRLRALRVPMNQIHSERFEY